MFQLFAERRNATLLTALFVVCFTLMTVSVRMRGGATIVERTVLTISGPLLRAAVAPIHWIQNLFDEYLVLQNMSAENEALKKELAALRGNAVRIQEMKAQIARLEAIVKGARRLSAQVRLARIVGRGRSIYGKTLLVDLGSGDGIRRNMPVIHQAGVVGRISRVGRDISQVLLLTDSRSAVDVIVLRTRTQGVFSFSSSGQGEVRYIPADREVKPGDLLIASGLGGIFPKGLPVARVTRVGLKGKRLFRRVEAKPAVDFTRLEEVLVMLTPPRGRPEK